jgi:hypothetical protein
MPGLDNDDAKLLDKPEQETAPLMMFWESSKAKGYEPVKGKEDDYSDHFINGSSDLSHEGVDEEETIEKNNASYQNPVLTTTQQNEQNQTIIQLPEELVEILNGNEMKDHHIIFLNEHEYKYYSRQMECLDYFPSCLKEPDPINTGEEIKKHIKQALTKNQNDKTQEDHKSDTLEPDNKILNKFDDYFRWHFLTKKNLNVFFQTNRIIVEKEMDSLRSDNTLQRKKRDSSDSDESNLEINEDTQRDDQNNGADNELEFNENDQKIKNNSFNLLPIVNATNEEDNNIKIDSTLGQWNKFKSSDLNTKHFVYNHKKSNQPKINNKVKKTGNSLPKNKFKWVELKINSPIPQSSTVKIKNTMENIFTEKTPLISPQDEANDSSIRIEINSQHVTELHTALESCLTKLKEKDNINYALSLFERTKKLSSTTEKLYEYLTENKNNNVIKKILENKIQDDYIVSLEELKDYVKSSLSDNH